MPSCWVSFWFSHQDFCDGICFYLDLLILFCFAFFCWIQSGFIMVSWNDASPFWILKMWTSGPDTHKHWVLDFDQYSTTTFLICLRSDLSMLTPTSHRLHQILSNEPSKSGFLHLQDNRENFGHYELQFFQRQNIVKNDLVDPHQPNFLIKKLL